MAPIIMLLQFLAALLFAMIAGSVFGIWRGYDPTTFSATTFLETHQSAVRGLNVLLPGMALVSIVLTLALTWLSWRSGGVFWLYLGALLFMVAGGVVTGFFNQPINAEVMGWTADTLPDNWAGVRARWWTWHLIRTALSVLGLALLLAAIIVGRPALR